MLRTYLALSLLLFTISSAAQTASDLTARYGHPDAERFVVGPEITMMAKYAANQSVCEMLIEPKRSIEQSDYKEQGMATSAVSKIIDKLIPVTERGIRLLGAIESVGAPQAQVTIYQNVKISRSFVRYLPAHRDETSAIVVRTDWLCGWPASPQKYVPVVALDATDLHSRYGDPDVQRFEVRPGITLTLSYGRGQMACRMVIEPTRSIHREESDKYVLPEVMSEIIDEVVPEADRGKLLFGIVTKSGCNDLEMDDYENVRIQRFRHRCLLPNPEIEGAATITSKHQSCAASGGNLTDVPTP